MPHHRTFRHRKSESDAGSSPEPGSGAHRGQRWHVRPAVALLATGALGTAGLGLLPAAASASSPRPAAPAASSRADAASTSTPAQAQLNALEDVRVGSAVAPNGDDNPYGIAVVPKTIGALTAGNLLVADFNNAAGTAGAGTSIVQVDPATGQTTLFFAGAPVAGPVGIAINPVNDGVWVGDYGAASDGTGANDLLISPAGKLVATYTDATTAGQASFVGVWGQGVSDANGVVSFYYGNAGNATTGTGGGDVWRLTPHPTGPTNGQPVNATYAQIATGQPETAAGGNAGSAAGPQGLAYDAATGVLYETNDANNTLYAIPNAATTTGSTYSSTAAASGASGASVVYQGPALDSPENVVVDPFNGNLLVVNGAGNNDLVEISPAGQVVATRDLAPNEAPGALFGLAVGTGPSGTPVIYYGDDDTNTIHALELPQGYVAAGADGGVYAFGAASYAGSLPAAHVRPASPIVGSAEAPDGQGYWLVDARGGVFSFGGAAFFGSLPGLGVVPPAPIVGMAATPDGQGYWLVASDGAVYAFGGAAYAGGANTLGAGSGPATPVVGIAASPGGGYWLVDAHGGVFSFGGAAFFGSLPGLGVVPAAPIVGISATP
jgi:hypothetical protein